MLSYLVEIFFTCIFVFGLFLLVRILLGQIPQITPIKCLGCPKRMLAKDKQYKCTHCDKAFKQSWVLKSHLHINIGEKLYQDSQCKRCFSKKGKSYTPYKNTLEKKYSHAAIATIFMPNSHLKNPMRLLIGVKPDLCSQCNKFLSKLYLINRACMHFPVSSMSLSI